MEAKPITLFKTKKQAQELAGTCTQTSKMPCESYSIPTEACITGSKLAATQPDSICAHCYANKGFYMMYANKIKPAQQKRLDSIKSADWVPAMVKLIGSVSHFRWHDSGDIQSVEHLAKLAAIAEALPNTLFWLPTREYGIVKSYLATGQVLPLNLIVRLSAMFPDKPVKVPVSLQGFANILVANVHAQTKAEGWTCPAPTQGGQCNTCRACWSVEVQSVSYGLH